MIFNTVYDERNEEYLFDEPATHEKIDGFTYRIEYDGGLVYEEDIIIEEDVA